MTLIITLKSSEEKTTQITLTSSDEKTTLIITQTTSNEKKDDLEYYLVIQ